MHRNDQEAFSNEFKTIMKTYSKEYSSDVCDIWWDLLKDYSFTDVMHALRIHMRSSHFMPKPSNVIKILNEEVIKKNTTWSICQFKADRLECKNMAVVTDNLRGAAEWCRLHNAFRTSNYEIARVILYVCQEPEDKDYVMSDYFKLPRSDFEKKYLGPVRDLVIKVYPEFLRSVKI